MTDLFGLAELAGRVVLVTGGSRGIGRAVVLAFAAVGCRVAFCYRTDHAAAAAVEESAAANGWQVKGFQADVTERRAVEGLVAQVTGAFGPVEILVNNAGAFPARSVVEMSDEEWEQIIRLNLTSVFLCSRAVLPTMIEARRGVIVNVASMAGQRGSAFHAHYAAAKGGVLAFTRSLAREVIQFGIRVNAVSPGRIETDLLMATSAVDYDRWLADTPARRLGTVEEVAAAVVFLATPAAGYCVGETIAVNGGLIME